MTESRKIEVGNVQLAYREYGKGYPIIMVMGYSGTMSIWDPRVIANLASNYRVITFDNRGMGESSIPSGEFTIEQLANDIARLMTALDIRDAHLLGWSMGTYMVQELALSRPDMVNRIILYAGDCGGKEAIWPNRDVINMITDMTVPVSVRGARMIRLLFPDEWLRHHFDYVKKVFGGPEETPAVDSIIKQASAWEKWRGSFSRLSQLDKKTLVITGTEDILSPPENSTMLAKKIPHAKLIRFEGTGHGTMYQIPDAFSKTVLDFLAEE